MSEDMLEKIDPEKRHLLKKVAAATIFTLPVVQSFSMNGFSTQIAEAGYRPPPASPM